MALYRIQRTFRFSRFWYAIYTVKFLLTRKRSPWMLRRLAKKKVVARPVDLARFHPAVRLRRAR